MLTVLEIMGMIALTGAVVLMVLMVGIMLFMFLFCASEFLNIHV